MISVGSAISMSTRVCDYSLGLQDDSVFADFSIDQKGCIYLVRISFDGYGCHSLGNNAQASSVMNADDSHAFKNLLENKDFDNPIIGDILSRYFQHIKDIVWEDALIDHQLIKPSS